MTVVAVLGGGAGGAAATADLCLQGYRVRLWSRSPETLRPLLAARGVAYDGVLGTGLVRAETMTADLPVALEGAEVILVCLPALGHGLVASALADAGVSVPIVLNPGHTGGALHFREVFREAGTAMPPVAELSTLAYVARKYAPHQVTISCKAGHLRGACLPGGEEALKIASELYSVVMRERDVLATSLANVNVVLHPPGAVLAAAWVEATQGDFFFYSDAVTGGVANTIAALDRERLAIAEALGHRLPPLQEEMAAIGTADPSAAAQGDLARAIALGEPNRKIRAPESLEHRYYREDFGHGLVPLLELARIAGVEAPVAESLLLLAEVMLSRDLREEGLNATRLGVAGFDRAQLLDLVGRAVRA